MALHFLANSPPRKLSTKIWKQKSGYAWCSKIGKKWSCFLDTSHMYDFCVVRSSFKARPCPFILILSWFYPDFILNLSRFYPDFIQILSRFFENSLYPNFIQISSWFYLDKIWIISGQNRDLDKRTWTGLLYLETPWPDSRYCRL